MKIKNKITETVTYTKTIFSFEKDEIEMSIRVYENGGYTFHDCYEVEIDMSPDNDNNCDFYGKYVDEILEYMNL